MNRELLEFAFYYHTNIEQAVREKRLDSGTPKTGGGGHSRISDPTAQKAIRACEPVGMVFVEYGCATNGKRGGKKIAEPEKLLKVVKETKEIYKRTYRGELIRRRYDLQEGRNETCLTMKMNLTRYHGLVNEILAKANEIWEGVKEC